MIIVLVTTLPGKRLCELNIIKLKYQRVGSVGWYVLGTREKFIYKSENIKEISEFMFCLCCADL